MYSNDQKEQRKQEARQAINRTSVKTYHASALLSLPFAYAAYLVGRNRFSENIGLLITLGIYFLSVTFFMRLIRKWLYKKPQSSSWHIWLD